MKWDERLEGIIKPVTKNYIFWNNVWNGLSLVVIIIGALFLVIGWDSFTEIFKLR